MNIKIKFTDGTVSEYNNVTRVSILDFDSKKEIEFVTKDEPFRTSIHTIENADKAVLEMVLSEFKKSDDEMKELDNETKSIINKNIWNLYDNS